MARTPRYGPDARRTVFEAFTGRTGADVSGSGTADITAQLTAAFGVSPRDANRPDTRAAAAGLGISMRQVQRYLTGTNRPGTVTGQRLTRAARQAASTQPGRRAAVASRRQSRAGQNTRVSITANQGPEPGSNYTRWRTVTMNLNGELTDGFYAAYIAGGEQAALSFLAANSAPAYNIDRWHFDTVDQLTIRDDLA